MNTGAISSRYARALLLYVQQTGAGERVFSQVRGILADPSAAPATLEPELENFIRLLLKNGRMEYVRLILTTFVRLYAKSEGIKPAHLTTVLPDPKLSAGLIAMLEKKTGCKVLLEEDTNPDLIGGFVLEIDDCRMDASVRGQLDSIRRSLQ